jgi:DNA-binding IclR family transcriptional regulator
MTHLIMSYIPARMVYVAAKLELVDHIHDAGIAPQDLAKKLDLSADALHRIMRVLGSASFVNT